MLEEYKLIPEMHLGQAGFTYEACEPFTKNKKRTQKIKKDQKIWDKFIKKN